MPIQTTVRNDNAKIRDGFETINTNLWDLSTDSADLVELAGNTQGSGYLKISKSVLKEDSETVLTSKFSVTGPVRLALGMSLSQRLNGQRFTFELVGIRDDGNIEQTIPLNPVITIANVSQTTTTLTVNTATNHNFYPGERIQIWGSPDSRANYGEVMVATVVTPTQFTVTSTVYTTIQSVTIASTNGGFCQKVDPFLQADNALGIFWEGANANNAKMISRSHKSAVYYSPESSFGTNHSNGVQANTGNFADAWNPSYMMDLRYKMEAVIARTFPLDSTGGYGGILKRSQVIPEIDNGYRIRIRARNNKAMTAPVARIVNAVKSGSSTATITTDIPHGLSVTDYVQIYGNRDQTNFANQVGHTQVASVPNSTSITIAYGGAFTGNTRGGSLIKGNGGLSVAPIAQTIQTLQITGGQMTLIGSATWSGILPGETVELHGIVDNSTGTVYSQFEGVGLKVLNLSTTTLVLACPTMADQALLTVGGTVFKRTDFRLHLFRALDYNRETVEVDGSTGNYADSQDAIAVNAINFSATNTITAGQAAHDAAATQSPVRIAGKAINVAPSAVSTTADVADLITTMVGALIQKPFAIPEADWSYVGAAPKTDTTDAVLKAAGAAGIRNYLTGIQIQNTNATATEIVIKDGSTVIWRGYAPASMAVVADITFPSPLRTTAATALNFACITTAANVYVNAQGYQAP